MGSREGDRMDGCRGGVRMKQEKYTIITLSVLDDEVEVTELKAKNKEEAYETIDEQSHNMEQNIVLNEKQCQNLKRVINEKKRDKKIKIKKITKKTHPKKLASLLEKSLKKKSA